MDFASNVEGGGGGHGVTHIFGALRYEPKGGGFDSLLDRWNFSLT